MSYNKDFYKNYEKYLKEDTVRRVHDSMFDVFEGVFNKTSPALDLNVVDFGCGLCEFFYFGVYTNYLGIDKNFARDETVVLDDYLTISKDNLIRKAKPKMKNGYNGGVKPQPVRR